MAKIGKEKVRVTYVDFVAPRVINIDDADPGSIPDVVGAYVKYAPTLPAAQRETFDAAAWKARFLQAGAIGVVVAPRFLGSAKTREAAGIVSAAAQQSPQQAFEAWLAELKGVSDTRRALAREIFEAVAAGGTR